MMTIQQNDIQDIINNQNKYLRQDIALYGIGIHPHFAYQWNQDVQNIIQQASQTKNYFIGEIGIEMRDQYLTQNPLELQKQVFKIQFQIAVQNNLPMSIHIVSRKEGCWPYLQQLLKSIQTINSKYQNIIFLHSYSGSFQQLLQLHKIYQNLAVGISYLNKDNKWIKQYQNFDGYIVAESDYDGDPEYDIAFNQDNYSQNLQERIFKDQQAYKYEQFLKQFFTFHLKMGQDQSQPGVQQQPDNQQQVQQQVQEQIEEQIEEQKQEVRQEVQIEQKQEVQQQNEQQPQQVKHNQYQLTEQKVEIKTIPQKQQISEEKKLFCTWNIFLSKNQKTKEDIQQIAQFSTVQEFLQLYMHMKLLYQIEPQTTIYFIKDQQNGKPTWEDHIKGSTFQSTVELNREQQQIQKSDEIFESLLFSLVGEHIQEPLVSGFSAAIKRDIVVFTVWIFDAIQKKKTYSRIQLKVANLLQSKARELKFTTNIDNINASKRNQKQQNRQQKPNQYRQQKNGKSTVNFGQKQNKQQPAQNKECNFELVVTDKQHQKKRNNNNNQQQKQQKQGYKIIDCSTL